jgi:hypothetical protein
MSEIQIRTIETEEDLLRLYPLIKKVPLINILHRDLLIKCLTSQAAMVVGSIDSVDKGVAIVERVQDNLHLLAVWAENSAVEIMPSFYSWAKELGVTRISMMSTYDKDSYERLFGVKLITAIYEKDLTEWQPE